MKLPLTGASATSTTSCCLASIGVTCSGTSVTRFDLSSKGITGAIPAEIGNLKNLTHLYLYNNQLSGSIPLSIWNMKNLQLLYLSKNKLNGTIPLSIGQLTNLVDLRLNENQLSGSIPSTIENLIKLQYLILLGNQLTGPIPSSIGKLTNLVDLRIHSNLLSGSIPTEIGSLVKLELLSLESNNLNGIIPSTIGKLINLRFLWLFKNQLSGSIPLSFGNLSKLELLSMYGNQLTGSIPLSIGQLTNLLHLDIYNNPSLSGNFTPRCGIQVSAQATGVSLCGCASSNSPAIRFPPAGTSDACLATGPASPLVKRSLTFSAVIGSFRYTCNVDDNQNPFQDCLNTMGKLCNPTYMSGNSVRISECKNAINTMTLGMNIFWRNVRRDCGQWPLNGFTGAVTSNDCTYANNQLQNNAYYIADGIKIYVTSDLTSTVNAGLWGNPALKG